MTAPHTGDPASVRPPSQPPATTADRPTSTPTRDPRPPSYPGTITMVMNGDMLLHETLWDSAHRIDAERTGHGAMDFRPMFADMRPFV